MIKMRDKEVIEREKFLKVYNKFDKWLKSIGFKNSPTNTIADYHWSKYEESVESLYGVEHFSNDYLMMSVRFLRDRHEHKFILLAGDGMGSHSEVMTLDEIKTSILEESKRIRDKKLKELESLKL